MAAAASITLDELPGYAAQMARRATAETFEPAMRRCAIAIKAMAKGFFADSRDPEGNPWPVLRHPRPRTGGADKPLRDTGLLQASMTGQGQGHIERVGDYTLEVGTNDQRAGLMNYGGIVRPRGKMLAIPLSKEATRYSGPRKGPRPFPRPLDLISRKGRLPLLIEHIVGKGKKKTRERDIIHYILVPWVEIPPRTFAGFSQEGLETCEQIISDYCVKKATE